MFYFVKCDDVMIGGDTWCIHNIHIYLYIKKNGNAGCREHLYYMLISLICEPVFCIVNSQMNVAYLLLYAPDYRQLRGLNYNFNLKLFLL